MNDDPMSTDVSPRSNIGLWATILVVGMLFLGWTLFLRPQISMKKATNGPGVGQPLVALDLQPLTNTTEGLTLDDVHGKVTLINFWGPWCGYCVVEFPHLIELWDKNRDNPEFKFVSVSSGGVRSEDVASLRAETEAFLKQRSVALPTYVDPTGSSRQMLLSVLGQMSMGYPTTVVLDRKGVIRGVWLGYQSGYEQQMERLVSTLLSEK